MRAFKYAFLGAILLFLIAGVFRRARAQDASAEARVYLRVRRAYEKAGYELKRHDAPMQFVKKLEQGDAPGHTHAKRVVELYLRARFSGSEISDEERRELRDEARLALSQGIRRAG